MEREAVPCQHNGSLLQAADGPAAVEKTRTGQSCHRRLPSAVNSN